MTKAIAVIIAATLAAGAAHAEEVDLKATLDQCRPDVARATTDELIARAEAAGWSGFEKGELGQLPAMISTRVEDPEARRSPYVSFGVLGVNGGGTWAFVCAVEAKPGRLGEIAAWTRDAYPDPEDNGWVGTRTGETMVREDREELVENLPTRLAELPAGQRIIMYSITGDRKKSTVVTQIFEKID